MTYAIFITTRHLIRALTLLAVIAIALSFFYPGAGRQLFQRIEGFFRRLAALPRVSLLAAALFPMLVRAIMLPWYPPPKPIVHDEYSYLLQADTFAHGRLANPVPPYWEHFETEYTLLQPTYASQYQPAQGLLLGAAQVLVGNPWWGVWVSVGLMCAAICWALRSVLPPAWALFGATIAALQFGIFGLWMNSYFGGALSATAGALVFGALERLRYPARWRKMAMLCAFGLILLFATRPLEGLLWSGVALAYAGWFLTKTFNDALPAWKNILLPSALVFSAGALLLAYYNWRVTGNALNPPYLAYQRIYGTPQPFWWQPPVFAAGFHFNQLRDNYLNQVALYNARYSLKAMLLAEGQRLADFWRFFVGPLLTPAILFAGQVFRIRRIRPWLFASIPFIADKATFHAWFPAHSGPATVLIVLLLVECWRSMRVWRRRLRTGVAMSRMLLAALCFAIFCGAAGRPAESVLPPFMRHLPPIWAPLYPARRLRDDVSEILEKIPGQHLLFVRYSPGHCFCEEWVFNKADPFSQKIVYVRPYSPESDRALIKAFSGFKVWQIEPDLKPYRLTRAETGEPDTVGFATSERSAP